MEFETLLLIGVVITAYMFCLILIVFLRLSIDAGWILALGVFFELLGFLISSMNTNLSPIPLLIAIPLGPVILCILSSPSRIWEALIQPSVWIWLAFLLYCLLSLLWSSNVEYGLYKWFVLIVRGVLPGLFILIIYKIHGKLSWEPVLIFGSIYAIVFLIFSQESVEYPGRSSLQGGNPIWEARSLLMLSTVALWYSKGPRWLRLIALTLSLIAAIDTQSRGPLASFLLASLAVVVITFFSGITFSKIKRAFGYTVGTIAIIGMIIVSTLYSPSTFGFLEGSRLEVIVNPDLLVDDPNFLGRLQLQEVAINLFYNNPIFGVGLGGFAPGERLYPHNLFLEIASEVGLVGLLLWIFALRTAFKAVHDNRILLALLLQGVFYSLFSGDLGSNYEIVLVGLTTLALYTRLKEDKQYVSN